MARTFRVLKGLLSGCFLLCAPLLADQPASQQQLVESYGKLPLSFEANHGQVPASAGEQVRFLSRGDGYSLFLTGREAMLSLRKAAATPKDGQTSASPLGDLVRMRLLGATPSPRLAGEQPLPGTANYLVGNDAANWRTGIETFAKVRYTGIYPGIDLVFYGNQRQLEYDFEVAPGASPGKIRLIFAGARITLDGDGNLVLRGGNGSLVFSRPTVYQEDHGQRQQIQSRFALLRHGAVGFSLGSYNHRKPLIIDPILQ